MKITKVQKINNGYKVTAEGEEYSISYLPTTYLYKETKKYIDDGGIIEPEFSFKKLQNTKINQINQFCETAIVSGFKSSALGIEHTYKSDRDDQINLMGLVTTGLDDVCKCSDGEIWEWKPHTSTQLKEVFDNGIAYKKQMLIKANTYKNQVLSATTVEEINKIVW